MTPPAVAHLNADFLRSLPDDGPVVMVNLVKLRDRALNGDGSGWDAYQRYSAAVVKLLKRRAAAILWAGTVEGGALADHVILAVKESFGKFRE